MARLIVSKFDAAKLRSEETRYGAHFRGSLLGGRVSADFGAVGRVAVHFRADGAPKTFKQLKGCTGRRSQSETGNWVGKVSLRGEGGYFAISTGSAPGERDRTFLTRCQVKRTVAPPKPESLRERIEPEVGGSLVSLLAGTASNLEAVNAGDGRWVELRAAHANGSGPGAEVEAGEFEYQGKMPVGRLVQTLEAPAGTLVTSLPGERPATATLKPGAPFSGEASYLATSPASHSWTGTLAVRFPGLVEPLTGPEFTSSLCVVSLLLQPKGCEYQPPDLQGSEESSSAGEGR
jgi:hypothetical protein